MRSPTGSLDGGVRSRPAAARDGGRVLVTGGAGFVGANLCARLAERGERVMVFDNLGRPGAVSNLRWLRDRYGPQVQCVVADVRDADAVGRAVAGASWVVHLAGQVAVTTSLANPRADFEVNVGGTLNLLEALRRRPDPPPLLFTSSNKVYGGLSDVELEPRRRRVVPADPTLRRHGVSESRPIDLHTPYACSKGAAELYVRDYARCFGLTTVVFRMSCIYGPLQHGSEDQGWVAHFVRRALEDRSLTIYGDGRQVRDVLFVDDLVDAMLRAREKAGALRGGVFNVGGGGAHTLSLLELLDLLRELGGRAPRVRRNGVRPGDQRYYVSDTRRLTRATGWRPRVPPRVGVTRLLDWLREHRTPLAAGGVRAGAAAS